MKDINQISKKAMLVQDHSPVYQGSKQKNDA